MTFPNGEIAVGLARTGLFSEVIRLRASGLINSEFGEAGQLKLQLLSSDGRNQGFFQPTGQLGPLPDGKLIVAGTASTANAGQPEYRLAAVRFTPNGHVDPTYGADGTATVRFPGFVFGIALAVQRSGRAFIAGSTYIPEKTSSGFAAACLRPDGRPDPRFGRGGRARLSFGGWGRAYRIVLQRRGALVLVGGSHRENSPGPLNVTALARLRMHKRVR